MFKMKYEIDRVPRGVADNASDEDKEKAMKLVSELLKSVGMDCYIISASNIEQVMSGAGELMVKIQCPSQFLILHTLKIVELALEDGDIRTVVDLTAVSLAVKDMIRKKLINLSAGLKEEDD